MNENEVICFLRDGWELVCCTPSFHFYLERELERHEVSREVVHKLLEQYVIREGVKRHNCITYEFKSPADIC